MTPELDDRAEMIGMIRASAAGIADAADFGRVRQARFRQPGYSPAVLTEIGALGWIGLRVPEAAGGVGLGMPEAVALHEELGRGLTPEPVIAAMLSAGVLAAGQPGSLLAAVLSGETFAPVAWQDRTGGLSAAGGENDRLFIPSPGGASHVLIPLEHDGRLSVAQIEIGDDLRLAGLQDGGFVGALAAGPVWRDHIILADAGDLLRDLLDEAALFTAAQLLGVADRALAMTLAYLRERRQFDRPLGSFQALQHRCVDMHIQVSLTRASVEAAARAFETSRTEDRQAGVSRAKARASDTALLVAKEAVQMFGAIGYTDEHDIGLFVRRAMVLANQFGSADFHRRRFARAFPSGER